MELYIGGYAQGKREYVIKQYNISPQEILDGGKDDFESEENARVYDRFHLWVRRKLAEGKSPEELTGGLMRKNPDSIIICDEIGNGIVPVDAAEREYRERTGRILCGLAGQASRVERIVCGIGQRIK